MAAGDNAALFGGFSENYQNAPPDLMPNVVQLSPVTRRTPWVAFSLSQSPTTALHASSIFWLVETVASLPRLRSSSYGRRKPDFAIKFGTANELGERFPAHEEMIVQRPLVSGR